MFLPIADAGLTVRELEAEALLAHGGAVPFVLALCERDRTSKRLATCLARITGVRGSRTANSSPPSRQARSPSRTCVVRSCATASSTASFRPK